MKQLTFEWDDAKNISNKAKHGIDFETAAVVYTERRDAIRIISARLATAKERRLYYGNGQEEY